MKLPLKMQKSRHCEGVKLVDLGKSIDLGMIEGIKVVERKPEIKPLNLDFDFGRE
jgi:hypothetical protein